MEPQAQAAQVAAQMNPNMMQATGQMMQAQAGQPQPQGPQQQQQPQAVRYGNAQAPIVLSTEQAEALMQQLTQALDYHTQVISPLLNKTTRWLEMYNVVAKQKMEPWPNASNYIVPFMAEKIMSIHARLVRAAFNVSPLWLVKPRAAEVSDYAENIERWLDFLAEQGEFKPVIDTAMLYSLIEGTGVIKIDYRRSKRQINNKSSGQMEEFSDFEGPRVTYVQLQDFMVVPVTIQNLDEALGVGHRFWLTKEELLDRQTRQIYQEVDAIVDTKSYGEDQKGSTSTPLGTIQNLPSQVAERYELWELYWKYDVYGNGQAIPVSITYSKSGRKILRIIPFPYEHGRAPYVALRPIPAPNIFYGIPFAQYLEPIQVELTASYQRRSDAQARKILTPILRKRGSTWKPEKQPLAPNTVIDVTMMDEIQPLQLPDPGDASMNSEQFLMMIGERLTGMGDYQMGRSAGSNRTYGEVKSVLDEGQVRIDVLLDRMQVDLRRLGELTLDIGYQFMPYGGNVQGAQIFFKVDPAMIRPPGIGYSAYRIVPNGSMSEASKDAKFQRDMVMTSQFLQDPINNPQMVGPQAMLVRAALWAKMLQQAGWLDAERYVMPVVQQIQQQMAAQQQQQEQMAALQQAAAAGDPNAQAQLFEMEAAAQQQQAAAQGGQK